MQRYAKTNLRCAAVTVPDELRLFFVVDLRELVQAVSLKPRGLTIQQASAPSTRGPGASLRGIKIGGSIMLFCFRKVGLLLGSAGGIAAALVSPAFAGGSLKDEMTPAGRQLEWSVNFGATTDYVFRGISQSDEKPAVQGGVDFTYGIFYAGIWGSMIDFGDDISAEAEVDFYAGIKPEWRGITFDLGVIYYTYPDAKDGGGELNYVELKAGASTSPIQNLTVGGTVFYSPEYTGETGEVWTFEGSAGYELRKIGMLTPTVSALLGYETGDEIEEYFYWNAGLSLAVDKLTLDFRYWDTDIDGGCSGLCDERFVASAKLTF